MNYSFSEIHALNLLSDDETYSRHFTTPPDLKIMTSIILACVLVALAGAILFKVDKIVPSQGILDTKAELFEIRNTEPGFIEHLAVKEGDKVVKGDVLVQFETRLADLEIARLKQDLNALSRGLWNDYYQITPLLSTKDVDTLDTALAGIPNPIVSLGYEGYLARPYQDTLAVSVQTYHGLQAQLDSAKHQQKLTQQRLILQREEQERIEQLHQDGIESRASLDQVNSQVLDLRANLESSQDSIARLESELIRIKKEDQQTEGQYILERFMRIHDQLNGYRNTEFQLSQQQKLLNDLSVRAPISGQVDALLVQGDNERIPQTTTLLTIRPEYSETDLKIDIQIPTKYAIWVQPGMVFRASSLGNNPEDHGYIMGEISFIASSSEDIEGQRMYRMTGTITEIKSHRPESRDTLLRPGTALNVEIRAGKRRLINYIFDPFTKYLRTAMSEPS